MAPGLRVGRKFLIRALPVARAVMEFAQAGLAVVGKCVTPLRTNASSGGKTLTEQPVQIINDNSGFVPFEKAHIEAV